MFPLQGSLGSGLASLALGRQEHALALPTTAPAVSGLALLFTTALFLLLGLFCSSSPSATELCTSTRGTSSSSTLIL